MKRLTFVKLGGSLITDKSKPLTPKKAVIGSLARQLKSAGLKYKGSLIVGHGSGSYGHYSASKYQTQKGLIKTQPKKTSLKGVSEVADVASRLTKITVGILREAGISAVAFAPISFIFSHKQEEKSRFAEPIDHALKIGLTPLVYGDVVFDSAQGFCIYSTEKVIGVLAKALGIKYRIERIVYCTTTDGVYDAEGKTITEITPDNLKKVESLIGGSKAVDVTGGMIHKVRQSLEVAKRHKTEVLIINGLKKGNLVKAILGKKTEGTLIRA